MSPLDFELFVMRTILEAAQGSYLSPLALWRLEVALKRVQVAHDRAQRG